MPEIEVRDWKPMWERNARRLERRTGRSLASWNRRIRRLGFSEADSLRQWLDREGVTGYPQSLLVMERFGYPEFADASADALVNAQFADRPKLRPIYEAIVAGCGTLGEAAVQTRKTYVSIVTPRRPFARLRPTTRTWLDLGLRLAGVRPSGRWTPAKIHDSLTIEIGRASTSEFDANVRAELRRAYDENR